MYGSGLGECQLFLRVSALGSLLLLGIEEITHYSILSLKVQ